MRVNENKDFVDGKLYTVVNYIYWILMSSILFIVTNIAFAFILFVSVAALQQKAIPVFIIFMALAIASLPMGPSFTALFTVMDKVIKRSDVAVVSDFFRGYRRNFGKSILAWSIVLFFLTLAMVNYYIIIQTGTAEFLIFPIFLLTAFLLCANFYIFPLISKYYLSTKDTFRLALYFSLKEFKVTLLILVATILVGIMFFMFPSILFIVAPGLLALIIQFLVRHPLSVVQAKVKEVEING